MKNRLQLQPKVSNKVSISNTLVIASAGVGLFLLLFVGAFIYLNMGNTEKTVAATVNTASGNGFWQASGTWSIGTPANNQEIVIPANVIVTINTNINLNNVVIKVYGILRFNNGKLTLNDASEIQVAATGDLQSFHNGNSDQLQIGNEKWKGEFIDAVNSPSQLTKDGEFNNNLLPIELEFFQATTTPGKSILITWGTISEKENDFFTLERSTDGKTFDIITTVDGAGDSNKKLSYSFEDKLASAGMNYYRLKQTDFNGDFEYFKIVGVNNPNGSISQSRNDSAEKIETLTVDKAYPNPFSSTVNLSFNAEDSGEVEVLIQNAMGEIIHKERVSYHYGNNVYTFDRASQFKPGIYFLNLWQNGKKIKALRVIKS